ncbi:hypothetical protein SHELI_v1c07870 [Spiroplasma helicoides]|uniref:Uncharacterized protein n=1 Tax=Spiroplasma helicoides TaxID=216938 RepID=A0A1B3SLC1_9MOLU|nr:hypothetical protein [Spiroplasma helicoides]AOG60736.1 hypothetical protein SHELI_v1c07870 [Spiroplasma helicoides]
MRSIHSTKVFAIIAHAFGILVTVFLLGYMLVNIRDLKNYNNMIDLTNISLNTVITLIVFFGVMGIISSAYVIYFSAKSDDDTFVNNRYILMLFSLSVGGIITPFLLMRLPNSDVQTSINPRISISRGYGACFLGSGLAAIACYLFTYSTLNGDLNLFDTDETSKKATIIILTVSAVCIIWGLANIATFVGNDVRTKFDKEGSATRGFMLFLSTVNLIIATITLVWIIISSILTIISIITDMFERRRGLLGSIFNGMIATLRIALQMFIIYTAIQCIKGIWSRNGQFTYGQYQNLANKQKQYDESRR